jgi:acetyltransferase-like isoleucine patch superfamily enzyme
MTEQGLSSRMARRIPTPLLPAARWLKLNLKGLGLYLAFLTGRVPSHLFRLFVYRCVFRVKIGKRSAVHWRARFYAPGGVSIGNNTIIGYDAFLDGRFGIVIGDNVNIGGEVAIFTAQHDPDARDFAMVGAPVRIGDYAYVGTRATILPGVTIGEGAVVATGAVVTKDVAPYSVVGGVPARYIKDRRRDLNYTLSFRMPFQ